jgi:hypothetical protein
MSSRAIRGPFKFDSTTTITTGNLTVSNESIVFANKTSGAATTVTLPAAGGAAGSRRVVLVVDQKGDAATNNITVQVASSGTINGASTYVMAENFACAAFIDNGTQWDLLFASLGVSATELAVLNGVTNGTSAASKALIADSSGNLAFTGALTTTDGVSAGTARKVGGTASVGVSTSDTITAAASNNAFVSFAQTYPIPASTIKAGTMIRVRAMVDVINAAAGTATLTINLRLGGTSLIATTAIDQAANDWQSIEFTLVGRAAPGAAAAVVGVGRWTTSTGGTNVTKEAILQSTNFATNGALTLDCQAKWSAADATTTCQLELLTVEVIG